MILAESSGWGGTLILGVLVLVIAATAFLYGRSRRRAQDVDVELERDRLKDEKELAGKTTGELVDRARGRGIIGGDLAADLREHPGNSDDRDETGTPEGGSGRGGSSSR